jgi:aerobic C4-dicarboxylate transport protein
MFFRVIALIVRAAPIGAFGAMAFTIGANGVGSLWNLVQLILTFYFTSILFVVLVLGGIAWLAGFSILRFLIYIKDELLIVLGTSSSETVLPHMTKWSGSPPRARWWASSSRPATASIWTAPTST